MTTLEQDIDYIKKAISRIEKVLGINSLTPGKVIELDRQARIKAEKIREKLNGCPSKK